MVVFTALQREYTRVWGNRLEADIMGAELDQLFLSHSLLCISTKMPYYNTIQNKAHQSSVEEKKKRNKNGFLRRKRRNSPRHFPPSMDFQCSDPSYASECNTLMYFVPHWNIHSRALCCHWREREREKKPETLFSCLHHYCVKRANISLTVFYGIKRNRVCG